MGIKSLFIKGKQKALEQNDKLVDKVSQKIEKKYGDKAFKMAAIGAEATIRVYGVIEARNRIIKAIEKDFELDCKNNAGHETETIQHRIDMAKGTPEYCNMLDKIQLTWDNIDILKQEALRLYAK